MCDHGRVGMGIGLKKTGGRELLNLVWAQIGRDATKRCTSRSLMSHQNFRWIVASEPLTPGWATNLEYWPHQRTAGRTDSGKNNTPSGQHRGFVTWERALLTACSTPHMTAPTTQSWDKIPSLVEALSDELNWRERASGLTFLELGL